MEKAGIAMSVRNARIIGEMNEYKIENASASQSDEICDVVCRSISEVCGPDYGNDETVMRDWLSNKTPKNFASWISADSNYSVVTKHGSEVVGFALIHADHVMLNYLLPEHLGRGLGSMMLEALEEWARSRGFKELRCESTITAKRFYERHGYGPDGDPQLVGTILGEFPLRKSI